MEANNPAFPDCARLIGIDFLELQMVKTRWGCNGDWAPYTMLDTRWIGGCYFAGRGRNLGCHKPH
jgi:hypothetical protein